MRFGIGGMRFLIGNAGGPTFSVGNFDTSGFFILAYTDYGLSYSGRALAVSFAP